MALLEAAIAKGAHPSALLPEPATQLWSETLEKIAQGYARLVAWDDIKNDSPKIKNLPDCSHPTQKPRLPDDP